MDAFGGPAIDPTENVLSLVDAESKRQDGLRDAQDKFQNAVRDAGAAFQNELRKQADRHEERIERLRIRYEDRIESIKTAATSANSSLLATQLDRMNAALGDRITDLEKKSWETGGKTSISDPATAEALGKMAAAISSLKRADDTSSGREIGRSEVIAWIVAAAAVGGAIVKFLG